MENLNALLLVAQVMLSIALIGLVLIQHGKGADAVPHSAVVLRLQFLELKDRVTF